MTTPGTGEVWTYPGEDDSPYRHGGDPGASIHDASPNDVTDALEYLRGRLDAEDISTGELVHLQGLAAHIDPGDVQLLEAAGVPEFPEDDPPSELTANGIRYLIGAAGDDVDGWDWAVESLPTDYDGCDGMCTYGCGADPWYHLTEGMAHDEQDALRMAHDARADLIVEDAPHPYKA